MNDTIQIADTTVEPGQRRRLEIPVTRLPTETGLSVPVEVVNGSRPGPRLWLSAAVHGDELNGVEIIRRVLEELDTNHLSGTVIAVPIVNVFGFIQQSRYLPDRRDLNRSFPGSQRGSLASRLAHLFMSEIVSRCTHGIDIHTGSNHRTNLPQIRADLRNAETRRCAEAFHAPVMIDAHTRDGSLREAAAKRGIHALLYEAGQPLRFDPEAIQLGVDGVMRVLVSLEMWDHSPAPPDTRPLIATKTTWIRARRSGILRRKVALGEWVERRQTLGTIADAFGDDRVPVTTQNRGLVVGHTNNPLVYQGDGIVHLATEFED